MARRAGGFIAAWTPLPHDAPNIVADRFDAGQGWIPHGGNNIAVLQRLTFLLLLPLTLAQAAPPLQPLIDATPAGGTLRPKPGAYAGPATIAKAM
ncbi:MAG: hypothetical protein KDF48_01395, partial [Rhodocyclaceae bacterium]|nr:hypothetical protein [Rhodocyclaceae bacterium]